MFLAPVERPRGILGYVDAAMELVQQFDVWLADKALAPGYGKESKQVFNAIDKDGKPRKYFA